MFDRVDVMVGAVVRCHLNADDREADQATFVHLLLETLIAPPE